MTHPPTPRTFLTLPGEIRNKIYALTLEDAIPAKLSGRRVASDNNDNKPWPVTGAAALTQTCKQIRTEFRPLYMQKIGFWLELLFERTRDKHNVRRFLTTFSPDMDNDAIDAVIGQIESEFKSRLPRWFLAICVYGHGVRFYLKMGPFDGRHEVMCEARTSKTSGWARVD